MKLFARWRARHSHNATEDLTERIQRKSARGGHCYMCAVSGRLEPATVGELCDRHFREVEFPRIELL